MLTFYARHHNRIQFFGFEVANIIWILHQALSGGSTGHGLNVESCAALFFLIGSGLIWAFDPDRRPQMLFYGGISLAIGGLFLAAAGFALTGMAVAVASLETARGGVGMLHASHRITVRVAHISIGWYQSIVDLVARCFPKVGCFIDERPFITGTLIKAPLRLEFIGKKVLIGDWIGAAVGLSWMLLGDVALAFNDPHCRHLQSGRRARHQIWQKNPRQNLLTL